MANKRDLKKKINEICTILYTRCSLQQQTLKEVRVTDVEGIVKGILFLQKNMLHICNTIPRKGGGDYLKRELTGYKATIMDLSEQIDSL